MSVLIAATISDANGCILNEGSINPCVIFGIDMGETLYNLAMMGWLGLLFIPLASIGLLIAIIWAMILIIATVLRNRS